MTPEDVITALSPIVDPAWTGPVPEPYEDYDPTRFLCPPKIFADGRTAWGVPTLFGGRIALALRPLPLALGFADHWCYNSLGSVQDSRAAAVRALQAWDGTGEPAGWMKHPASGRYRDDGDPLQEYLEGTVEQFERERARWKK